MIQRIKALVTDEEGATMVEYALMLALIAVICILAVTAIGKKSANTFGAAGNAIEAPAATP